MLPLDPFNRSRLPGDLTRSDRVRLLGEVFRALMEGRQPSREAALFVGGGGLAWLDRGGSLTRDFWRTAGPQGSTHTESVLWQQLQSSSRRTTNEKPADTVEASSTATASESTT
jgi:hypothetical protein